MRATTALMISALVVISAASCTTTEVVEVRPTCTPPPEPSLPAIDRGELWDALGDDDYRELERYINRLWGYADEQAAMLDEACGDGSPED